MMNDRQAKILRAVVEEYIRTAEPVASKTITDKYVSAVSPATVRNDLMALTESLFLLQPHTSAGRVPTEQGYRYYLDHFMKVERAERVAGELKAAIVNAQTPEAVLRAVSQALVELSGDTAVVASEHGSQYTGIANLMRKPEFDNAERREKIANAIDHVDQAVAELLALAGEDVRVWLGSDSPLSSEMATIVVRVRLPDGSVGLLGLLGPLRMRYGRNIGLLQEVKKMLDTTYEERD